MVDFIEQCRMACHELIDVGARASIQAVLDLSGQQAGSGTPSAGQAAGWEGGLNMANNPEP